jgi:hypothetical protein
MALFLSPPVFWLFALKSPERDKVAMVVVKVVVVLPFVDAVLPPTVTEAQFNVPAPAVVAAVEIVAESWRVTPAVTVRMTPELTVKVAAVELLLSKAAELIVAFAVTVIESPARMITSSVVAGTVPPGHGAFVVVEFQLPLPAVVTVAAGAVKATKSAAMSVRRGRTLTGGPGPRS